MSIIRTKQNNLKKETNTVLEHLKTLSPSSKEYTTTAENLKILLDAQKKDEKKKFNLDTVLTGVFSLVGIVIIVWSEETRVITSKALSFVVKGRV